MHTFANLCRDCPTSALRYGQRVIDDRSDRIKRSSPVALWRQVADDITADIDAGRLKPDDRLPTEPELQERYGVSRDTVRRAIAELRTEGRVAIARARGTFVLR